jgi:hypothetical protein
MTPRPLSLVTLNTNGQLVELAADRQDGRQWATTNKWRPPFRDAMWLKFVALCDFDFSRAWWEGKGPGSELLARVIQEGNGRLIDMDFRFGRGTGDIREIVQWMKRSVRID